MISDRHMLRLMAHREDKESGVRFILSRLVPLCRDVRPEDLIEVALQKEEGGLLAPEDAGVEVRCAEALLGAAVEQLKRKPRETCPGQEEIFVKVDLVQGAWSVQSDLSRDRLLWLRRLLLWFFRHSTERRELILWILKRLYF